MTNEEIVLKIQSGNGTAEDMEVLYNQNKGMIYKCAVKFADKACIDDLLQEAYILLDRAVKSYDSSKGIKFITYYSSALPHYFSLYLMKSNHSIRLPKDIYYEVKRYVHFLNQYIEDNDKNPTDNEAKAALRYSDLKLENVKQAYNTLRMRSLDEELTEDGFTLSDIITDKSSFEDELDEVSEKEYIKKTLETAVDRLNPKERSVIKQKYFEGLSQSDIGKAMGVSYQYIGDVKNTALRHLRKDAELNELARKYNYTSRTAYHYSLDRFKNSGMSSVELLAEKRIEWKKQQALIYEMLKTS